MKFISCSSHSFFDLRAEQCLWIEDRTFWSYKLDYFCPIFACDSNRFMIKLPSVVLHLSHAFPSVMITKVTDHVDVGCQHREIIGEWPWRSGLCQDSQLHARSNTNVLLMVSSPNWGCFYHDTRVSCVQTFWPSCKDVQLGCNLPLLHPNVSWFSWFSLLNSYLKSKFYAKSPLKFPLKCSQLLPPHLCVVKELCLPVLSPMRKTPKHLSGFPLNLSRFDANGPVFERIPEPWGCVTEI